MTRKQLDKLFGAAKVKRAMDHFEQFAIEVPSWGFGRGGTRFAAYAAPGDAATLADKLARAADFRDRTGHGQTVALHFPWDGSTEADYAQLEQALAQHNLEAGSVNINLFSQRDTGALDDRMRFGTLTNPEPAVRRAAQTHHAESIELMRRLGSTTLVLWLPDGANSPGQMSFFDQADRLEKEVKKTGAKLKRTERLLIEYKLFEPGMYSTAIPDYAVSRTLCRAAGRQARVLVDLGHHAPSVNIEQIVALLIRDGSLGGFHFNDKQYADDDLASGSLDPARLFRIFVTILDGVHRGKVKLTDIAFMIDESHQVKDPTEEMVESAFNIDTALAKASLVDFDRLRALQCECKISEADALLTDAFLTDVRPLVETAREKRIMR